MEFVEQKMFSNLKTKHLSEKIGFKNYVKHRKIYHNICLKKVSRFISFSNVNALLRKSNDFYNNIFLE